MDAVKSAPAFHIYVAPGIENGKVATVLEELGLQSKPLGDADSVIAPALIVLAPGEAAPEGLEDSTIRPPADAPPAGSRCRTRSSSSRSSSWRSRRGASTASSRS